MTIEFEPTFYVSKCDRFSVAFIGSGETPRTYRPRVYTDGVEHFGPLFPTFAAAVAWCEARKGAGDEVHNGATLG